VSDFSTGETPHERQPRLLEQVHDAIRRLHYSRRTEETYVDWIRRFSFWSGKCHPADLGEPEVTAFLSHLATERNVAAATQNQALAALLFLYKQVLGRELGWFDDLVRAKRPVRLPVVLTRGEVAALLAQLKGAHWLMASILYGAGLLGHSDVSTTMIYTHVLNDGGRGVKSPLDRLEQPRAAYRVRSAAVQAAGAV
jgi:site-specific recombinase XerD